MPCEPKHPAPAPRINRAIGAVSVPDILPRRPIGEGLPLGDLGEESVSQSIQPPGHEMAAQEAEPETETSESVESPRVHPDVTPLVIPIALASPPQEFVDPAPEPARNGFSSGPVLLADLNDVPSESPRITAQPVPGEEGQNSDREALPVQSDVLSSAPLDSRRGVDGTHSWKPAVRVSLPPSEGVQTSSDPIGIQLDERRTQGSHAPHPWHPIAEGMATSNREAVLTSVPQGFAPQAGRVGARLQRLAGSSAAQQDMTLWGATPELEPVGRQAPLEESVQAPMTNAPAVIADPPVARQRQDAPSRRTVADGGASSRTGRLLGSLQVSAEVPDNGIAGGVAPQQGARSRSDATPLHVGSRALTEATPDLHGIQPVVDSPSLRAVSGAESAAPWAGSGNPGEADGQGGGPPYQPLDESPPTADHSSRPPSQRVLAGRSSTPSRGGATAQASTPGPVESVPPPPGPLKETSSSPSRIPAGPESGQGIREGVPTGGRSRPPGRSDEVNSPGALSTLIGPGVHHLRDHETPPATEVLPGTPLRHDTPAGESLPRRMEIETLGQGRLQLTLTQQGQELRIDALELGNALSGTEAGWQELQSRLEGAGILLGPLESAPQQPGSTGDRNPHDPRHAACYEAGMNSSGQPDSAPDSQVRKRILIPDAPADSAQVHRGSKGVVPGRTRGTGREWWA